MITCVLRVCVWLCTSARPMCVCTFSLIAQTLWYAHAFCMALWESRMGLQQPDDSLAGVGIWPQALVTVVSGTKLGLTQDRSPLRQNQKKKFRLTRTQELMWELKHQPWSSGNKSPLICIGYDVALMSNSCRLIAFTAILSDVPPFASLRVCMNLNICL